MDMSLYQVLVHAHSVGRWIVLLLLIFAILNSLIAGKRPFIRTDARLGMILMIFADIMLLIGAYLWYAGPRGFNFIEEAGSFGEVMKDPFKRFFAVEHIAGMVIAIILIHIGKTQGRKAMSDKAKHRRTLIFYFLALLIILASVPWPFREIGQYSHWF